MPNNKIKVIAELCQNHKGDFKLIEEMVQAAAESGANIAKIQFMNLNLTHRKKFDQGIIEGGEVKVIRDPTKKNLIDLKNWT